MSSSYIETAIQAAREAGAHQMDRLGKIKNIEFKGEINLVTEVDRECERIIATHLQGKFPTHDMLAEEGSGFRRNSEYKWIVDPLDGTTNYAHTYPLFCVSIALEHKGEIIAGVVFEPNHAELFVAEKGSGSFMNNQKIQVSKSAPLKRSLVATGFAYNIAETNKNNIANFNNMLLSAQAVRRDGVAAVDLCYVACGRYDGFWELNLFPWDVAAGSLIIREAGGELSDFGGKAFSIYNKEILTSNGSIHQEMAKVLQEGKPL